MFPTFITDPEQEIYFIYTQAQCYPSLYPLVKMIG